MIDTCLGETGPISIHWRQEPVFDDDDDDDDDIDFRLFGPPEGY
jgi:hypothetical protein